MILPTKYIPQERAIIGLGAVLLKQLRFPATVSMLWDKVKDDKNVSTFERFVLALDMLHILGLVEMEDGILRKRLS